MKHIIVCTLHWLNFQKKGTAAECFKCLASGLRVHDRACTLSPAFLQPSGRFEVGAVMDMNGDVIMKLSRLSFSRFKHRGWQAGAAVSPCLSDTCSEPVPRWSPCPEGCFTFLFDLIQTHTTQTFIFEILNGKYFKMHLFYSYMFLLLLTYSSHLKSDEPQFSSTHTTKSFALKQIPFMVLKMLYTSLNSKSLK